MSAGILDVYLAMTASLTTSLQCDVVKGYPAWGRTRQGADDLPKGGMELNFVGTAQPRIGGQPGKKNASWRLWLFARDEVELATLLDRLFDWLTQNQAFDVNSSRVALALESSERYDSESAVQQEQHAFVLLFITSW